VDDGQLTAKVNQQEEVAHITIVAFVSRKIMTHYYVQNMPIIGENKSTTAAYRCFPALQMRKNGDSFALLVPTKNQQ
jgi:hypothetical protein